MSTGSQEETVTSTTSSTTSNHTTRKVSCLTCRNRRVKCDKAAPVCQACHRLSLECLSIPVARKFVWLPVTQADGDVESGCIRLRGQDSEISDGVWTEKATQMRRKALSTDKERQSMSEQLVQSTDCMDVDDILNLLRQSVDSKTQQSSLGPFTVFPTQPPTLRGTSLQSPSAVAASSTSTAHGSNGELPLSPEAWKASPSQYLDVLPPQDLPFMLLPTFGDDSVDVDLLSSILGPSCEEESVSGGDTAAAPFFISHTASENIIDIHWPQVEVGSSQLPSPLSVHLPFLKPSQILERVPKDTFFLLEYYGSKMLFVLSPLPSRKPPWKIMHHPTVLETTAALLVAEPVKHAQLALMYSILAISCFHLDWCTAKGTQTGNIVDTGSNIRTYWWSVGEQFERIAKAQLQLSLEAEFKGAAKAKYKHILMTLLCMVTICVLKGEMQNARRFLLDAEQVIRLRGLKPNPSRKIRLLHNIFLYNRIIEESTFVRTEAGRFEPGVHPSLLVSPATPSVSVGGSLHESIEGAAIGLHTTVADPCLLDRLIKDDGAWFETIYGVPITLMNLISQVTALARESESQQISDPSVGFHSMTSFASRARKLEDLICGFQWEPKHQVHEETYTQTNSPAIPFQPGCLTTPDSMHGSIMRHLISAMHQALLIFFYKRIRNLHPYALQPFVKGTISELVAFQRAKKDSGIMTPVPCWPGFIAGREAMDEQDRRRLREWFKQSGSGWRSFDVVRDMLEQFWESGNLETGTSGADNRTWEHFSRQHHIAIIAT